MISRIPLVTCALFLATFSIFTDVAKAEDQLSTDVRSDEALRPRKTKWEDDSRRSVCNEFLEYCLEESEDKNLPWNEAQDLSGYYECLMLSKFCPNTLGLDLLEDISTKE